MDWKFQYPFHWYGYGMSGLYVIETLPGMNPILSFVSADSTTGARRRLGGNYKTVEEAKRRAAALNRRLSKKSTRRRTYAKRKRAW